MWGEACAAACPQCPAASSIVASAGWFASASVLGGYGQPAQDGYVGAAAATAAKVWAVGTPAALVLRGLLKGYPPPTPFIAVAFGATAVVMIGWRSALAGATKPWVGFPELMSALARCTLAIGSMLNFDSTQAAMQVSAVS